MEKKDKINILYILNATTKFGGANKSFLNIVNGLDKNIYNPIILAPDNGAITKLLISEGYDVIVTKYFQDIYPSTQGFLRKILFFGNFLRYRATNYIARVKIVKLIEGLSIKFVHTNVGTVHMGSFLAKKLRLKHIWHLREYQDKDFNFRIFPNKKRFVSRLKANDFNICISKDIFDYFNLDLKNSKVVYNGIKSIKEVIFDREKGSYFLFAGRLEPNKGIDKLLESYYRYKTEFGGTLDLYIAGDSNNKHFKNMIELFVSDHNLEPNVKFLGMREDIDILMQKATALIVPSLYEGFGRITVEALFNGCLVIGYNNAGTAEILKDKDYGFLYNNESELIAFMQMFESNDVQYESLIRLAQGDLFKYSNEKYVEEILNIYLNIMR